MRHRQLGVLVAVAVLGTAGCTHVLPRTTSATTPSSSSSTVAATGESSDQIMQRALDALRGAHTFHVVGERKDGATTTTIDLSINIDQQTYIETLRTGGHTVVIRKLTDTMYIKADPGYWQQIVAAAPTAWNASPEHIAAILNGKYLVAVPQTVSSGADQTPALLDQELIYPSQAFVAFVDGPSTRDARTTLNGTTVITIRNLNQDSAENLNADLLYLTATGAPLPIRIEGPRGFLNFKDFGAPVSVTVPPAGQLVDIATLRAAPR